MRNNIITNGNPVKTGRIIDGKDEYIKRILIARFPNASTLEVSTGLDHSKINFGDVSGIAKSTEQQLNVPFVSLSGLGIQVATRLTSNNIAITTGNDRSSYSGYLDIRFTYKD